MASVVLVEGNSDRIALETLMTARRQTAPIEILSTNGAGGVAAGIAAARTRHGESVRLSGLYDIAEREAIRSALAAESLLDSANPDDLESAGFFACEPDLEGELIRAAGEAAVLATIVTAGEQRQLRSLQNQPAWRGRPLAEQLHRFMGSRSGRKAKYAGLLVRQLEPVAVPRPLDAVLRHASG